MKIVPGMSGSTSAAAEAGIIIHKARRRCQRQHVPGPFEEELPVDSVRQCVGLRVDGAGALQRPVRGGEAHVADERLLGLLLFFFVLFAALESAPIGSAPILHSGPFMITADRDRRLRTALLLPDRPGFVGSEELCVARPEPKHVLFANHLVTLAFERQKMAATVVRRRRATHV